jgi:hypothetical protein
MRFPNGFSNGLLLSPPSQDGQAKGKWARMVQITNWAFGFEPGHEIPLRALHTCAIHIRSGYRCDPLLQRPLSTSIVLPSKSLQ